MSDFSAHDASICRCPRCGGKRTLHRQMKDRFGEDTEGWICSRCGNNKDEFGNTLQ